MGYMPYDVTESRIIYHAQTIGHISKLLSYSNACQIERDSCAGFEKETKVSPTSVAISMF